MDNRQSAGPQDDDQQDDQNSFGQRKMYQGNWTCAQCGVEIKELPFEPDGSRPVYCPSCYRQRRQDRPQRRF